MTLPPKLSRPGISGAFGWDRKPVAVIRYRAVSDERSREEPSDFSPAARATRQVLASSSQRAPSTVVLKRMWVRTSYLSATSSAYCLISEPVENSRDQLGFGSKK